MALADPQKIKIEAVEHSCPRVSTGDYKSTYSNSDSTVDLSLSTQNGKRIRQTVRVDHSKIAADPFIPAQNVELSSSIYIVFDRPIAGYTNKQMLEIFKGFIENLQASSNLNVEKLLASES